MKTVILGKTNIEVNKNGFGALPIQRTDFKTAGYILKKAYDNGINYFDTASVYSDSEEKLGNALSSVRDNIVISTKTMSTTVDGFKQDLEESLRKLKTDHIDIYQFHNPAFCPKPGDESGIYDEMLKAKEEGKILHIGITNHRLSVAKEAIESGLYETMQFPFSYISSDAEREVMLLAREKNVGFIAMKALAGGLITDSRAAYAFMLENDAVEPIWGIQKESELDEFLSYQENAPALTEELKAVIKKDREELAEGFCRGCGYCMPCPQGITINQCARMSLLLRRAPIEAQLTEYWQAEMKKIETCFDCGKCKEKCPYGLDTPKLLRDCYEDYKTFLK